jgi:hypothetical protein
MKPSDAESIPGDLLEEYRAVRRPALGRLGADWWYVKQALSVLWRVMLPAVVAIVALRILSFPLPGKWNPSLVPAPGVSVLDAVIFVWAGYYGTRRTGRLSSGVVTAGFTSFLGYSIFFLYAAVRTPRLLLIPFESPFIFVIAVTLLGIAAAFGIVLGTLGAAVGRWLPSTPGRLRTS